MESHHIFKDRSNGLGFIRIIYGQSLLEVAELDLASDRASIDVIVILCEEVYDRIVFSLELMWIYGVVTRFDGISLISLGCVNGERR